MAHFEKPLMLAAFLIGHILVITAIIFKILLNNFVEKAAIARVIAK